MVEMRRLARFGAAAATVLLLVACSDSGAKRTVISTTTTVAPSTTARTESLPNGFLAIPTPAGVDPEFFGQNVSVTTTATGTPVVAFSILFEDAVESQVVTATYDEAIHQFKPTVHVASAALHGIAQSVSITRDAPGRTLAVAWDDGGAVLIARSTDDGATWTSATVVDGSEPLRSGHSPSIAVAQGKVAIAFVNGNGVPTVATGDLNATAFTLSQVPVPAGGPAPRSEPPAVAAAPDGSFGVSYLVTRDAGGVAASYLTVGGTTPVVALVSPENPVDPPSVALAFGPRGPVVGATLCREASPADACTWVTASVDNGASFGTPVKVPSDGDDTGGRVTRIGVDEAGHGAFAYTPASTTPAADATCGRPKVSTSTDLTTWRTCSPDPQNSLGLVPGAPALVVGVDGSVVVAFQQMSEAAKAPTGVLVVIYPPLGASLVSP